MNKEDMKKYKRVTDVTPDTPSVCLMCKKTDK